MPPDGTGDRAARAVRHARVTAWRSRLRAALTDLRPLDPVRSIKAKLSVIIGATVTMYMIVTWVGIRFEFGVLRTFPVALILSLAVTQLLARGMTRPLREMTAAADAMARGDYSTRVQTESQDEVGELARAFNSMASDLATLDTQRKEMVANVSHELRTPVAALRAQVENMADGVVEADAEALEATLAQIERLSRLMTYLLDLSRLEAGAAELNLSEIPIAEFLRQVTREAEHASAKNLRWQVRVTPAGAVLVGDDERLRQVLANLLSNASRHSPAGGTVTVTGRLESATGEVIIDVLDQGGGIPLADRARVFDRFERGNAPGQTGLPSTGGTGLGLAIARWAVGLHGGTIAVADPPGGAGTLIRVRLPARGSQRREHTQPIPQRPAAPDGRFHDPRPGHS
ncbi:HAMP domain-containing protein [Pseudactinotalea sp. HY160]|uniref:sensor histidine kinase n=1 Tax=Pseudactinotalea sp. HY160 TaxID=2654490 RepID=UPI00128B4DD7|nr:HAMP domain-containing sensor histidine kinase [Pseudactinotalea sp. HY160]MPV48897.1 HAMP domain-containing protein [Pseudactinotalea sp. HY160]